MISSTTGKDMSHRGLRKNYIFNLVYQALLVLTPVILTPYVSRVLGVDGVGTVSFAESVVSYFVLFATFGIATFGQREVSYVQDDLSERSFVFWNTKLLQVITSVTALALYGILVFVIGLSGTNTTLFLVYSINIFAVLFDVSWFYQGIERFDKICIRNIIFQTLSIIFVFVFVKGKGDTAKYVFGTTFFILVSNITMWLELPKYVCRVDLSRLRPFQDIRVVASLFLPSIAIQIYTILDRTMLGVIARNDFENGYYSQAMLVPRGLLVIVNALGTVVAPKIGYYFEKKDMTEVKELLYSVYRMVWFLAVPFWLGLSLVSDYFVPWFYGPGYDKIILLLKVAAPIIIFIGINSTTALEYLVPTKRQNIFSKALLIGAGTNFCLNLIFIYYFQSVGAAVASVIAECVINVVELTAMREEISIRRIFAEGKNYFIAGGVMAAALLTVRALQVKVFGVIPATIPYTALFVVIGAAAYFAVLLVLKDRMICSVIRRKKQK